MTKVIDLKTSVGEPLTLTVQLFTESEKQPTMTTLRAAAAALLVGANSFSLCYTDSDGDEVTIASDADVKELADYMADEDLERVTVLVTPADRRAANAVQTQLRGLVDAMSKLTTGVKAKKATPANAMNLLMASLQTMDVAEDSEELATIKKELLTVLEDGEVKKVVEVVCACDEFKELVDVMVAAIYEEDAQIIEETATARFDELLTFTQCVVARCPSLKPMLVNVAKQCFTSLVRLNDEKLVDDGPDPLEDSSNIFDDEIRGVESQEVPVHLGIICDGCEKAPLIGVRYKSLDLSDFDLCEDCEASGKWVSHEPFIKITDPSRVPKHKCTSDIFVHPFVVCDGCQMSPIVGARFKSKTADDFDLCEACEASGKWTELFGPFAKIQEPSMVHASKFSYRRGGKLGYHDKSGPHHGKNRHHHGHHGKFGHHTLHGPPGLPFQGPSHHLRGPRGFFGVNPPPHREDPPRFSRHDHRGPSGSPGHGPPFRHEGTTDFFERGSPLQSDFPQGILGNNRPDQDEGCPDFNPYGHSSHGPPPPIPEFMNRPWCHHGISGCGPPGYFGRNGAPTGFPGSHGPSAFPPDFSSEFEPREFRGFRGQHGRHGRHMRLSEDEEEQQKESYTSRRHGYRRCSRWGRDAFDLEARFLEDVTIEDGTVVEAEKPLRKMWKLANDGERSWPSGCYMITQRENPMLCEGKDSIRIDLPALAPGEEFIAGVDLVAPKEPGRYTSFWSVCNPAGIRFGHRFWIDIEVTGVAISEATPSEAPTVYSVKESETNIFEADLVSGASSDDDIEIIESAEAREALEMIEAAGTEESEAVVGADDDADAMAEDTDMVCFEKSLLLLASMGFTDSGKNLRALELAEGDVGNAVNALLSE